MNLSRYSPYLIVGTLGVLASLAFWRRGSDERARRAAERTEALAESVKVSHAVPSARSLPKSSSIPRPKVGATQTAPPVEGEEILKDLPSWEGKQLRDYTWEERQETGLTNEKLFANAGASHWLVLADSIKDQVDPAFFEEMMTLSEAYREAQHPYAPDDPEENVAKERELLARLEKTMKSESMSAEALTSYEFLKEHVEMWKTGEAEKLVDEKIERDNDAAKRIALRARQDEAAPSDPASGDEDP